METKEILILSKEELEELEKIKPIEFKTNEKNNIFFNLILNSNASIIQNYKVMIAQRLDLTEEEINTLINDYNNKDILINITRYQKLNDTQISKILERKNVLQVVVNLLEHHPLKEADKEKLIFQMEQFPRIYKNFLKKFKN